MNDFDMHYQYNPQKNVGPRGKKAENTLTGAAANVNIIYSHPGPGLNMSWAIHHVIIVSRQKTCLPLQLRQKTEHPSLQLNWPRNNTKNPYTCS